MRLTTAEDVSTSATVLLLLRVRVEGGGGMGESIQGVRLPSQREMFN